MTGISVYDAVCEQRFQHLDAELLDGEVLPYRGTRNASLADNMDKDISPERSDDAWPLAICSPRERSTL
jgi:hypothetical protein